MSNVNKVLNSPGWASVRAAPRRAVAARAPARVLRSRLPFDCAPPPAPQVTTDKLSLDDGPNMFYVLIDEVGVRR